jgi:hypothetical protein
MLSSGRPDSCPMFVSEQSEFECKTYNSSVTATLTGDSND